MVLVSHAFPLSGAHERSSICRALDGRFGSRSSSRSAAFSSSELVSRARLRPSSQARAAHPPRAHGRGAADGVRPRAAVQSSRSARYLSSPETYGLSRATGRSFTITSSAGVFEQTSSRSPSTGRCDLPLEVFAYGSSRRSDRGLLRRRAAVLDARALFVVTSPTAASTSTSRRPPAGRRRQDRPELHLLAIFLTSSALYLYASAYPAPALFARRGRDRLNGVLPDSARRSRTVAIPTPCCSSPAGRGRASASSRARGVSYGIYVYASRSRRRSSPSWAVTGRWRGRGRGLRADVRRRLRVGAARRGAGPPRCGSRRRHGRRFRPVAA